MEFKEVIGRRRSIRFFEPDKPVEREKIQIMLEAARLSSCAVNAHYPVWWHKSYAKSRRNPDVAAFVNGFVQSQTLDNGAENNGAANRDKNARRNRPLLLSDKKPAGQVLSLSHLLDADVTIQLVNRPKYI